jgi:predicted acyl esterase
MSINFDKRVLAACLIALPLLPLGAYAVAHHRHVSVEFYHSAMATMKDGTKLHARVIKMNGNMMAAVPRNDLPDYLQQQIFVPGDQ